jgi:hypothetical protein
MNEAQAIAWRDFESEAPWLNYSQRCLVGIASVMRARLVSGEEVGVQALGLLRLCLGSMGMTPADTSKISWAPEEEPDDLLDLTTAAGRCVSGESWPPMHPSERSCLRRLLQ